MEPDEPTLVQQLENCLISTYPGPNDNEEPPNVVDGLYAIAEEIKQLRIALTG